MAKKNNIRSIRFSDEIIEMIESQAGDSFTAKFEALVTRCMWELPQKEKELKRINDEIERQRESLERTRKAAAAVLMTTDQIKEATQYYNRLIERVTNKVESMLEEM